MDDRPILVTTPKLGVPNARYNVFPDRLATQICMAGNPVPVCNVSQNFSFANKSFRTCIWVNFPHLAHRCVCYTYFSFCNKSFVPLTHMYVHRSDERQELFQIQDVNHRRHEPRKYGIPCTADFPWTIRHVRKLEVVVILVPQSPWVFFFRRGSRKCVFSVLIIFWLRKTHRLCSKARASEVTRGRQRTRLAGSPWGDSPSIWCPLVLVLGGPRPIAYDQQLNRWVSHDSWVS